MPSADVHVSHRRCARYRKKRDTVNVVTDQEIADTQILDPEVAPGADRETVVIEALSIIDSALAKMMHRDLVSSGEVADLLLDVRTILTTKH